MASQAVGCTPDAIGSVQAALTVCTERAEREKRREREIRSDLCAVFTGMDVQTRTGGPRKLPTPPSEDLGVRFNVACESLKFALQVGDKNVEPFYGTLALYDVKENIKLSESFQFDLNR